MTHMRLSKESILVFLTYVIYHDKYNKSFRESFHSVHRLFSPYFNFSDLSTGHEIRLGGDLGNPISVDSISDRYF